MDRKKLIAGAAAAAVLTVGAGAAMAAGQQPRDTQQEKQDPAVNSSVKAPPETEANDAAEGSENDAAEASQLKDLAKIDRAAAEKAALEAAPGEVKETELDNENGSVVYSVEVAGKDGKSQEVIVDAGSGKVLAAQQDEEDGADEGPADAGEATR